MTAVASPSLLVDVQEPIAITKEEHQKARAMGFLSIVLGGFLFKIGLLDVLADAEAHAATVSTASKAVMASPFFVMVGLLLVVVGKPRSASALLHPTTGAIKPLGWLALVAIMAPGLILYLWLQSKLASLGYK